MAVTVEEYLRRPEYLDGEVIERHSEIHTALRSTGAHARVLPLSETELKLFGYPGLTLRLSPSRYRIADVAVFSGGLPAEKKYPTDPPEFAIEIVSEDDRFVEIIEKLAEYHTWGIKHVWLADPWTLKFFVYDGSELHEVLAFELPEYNAKVSVAEFFGDRAPQ
jgi:Uma2 family endonuclease